MNWMSSKQKLPSEGEEVLTFIHKKFHLAIFSQINGGFRLRDGNFLWIEREEVFWTALIAP